MLKINQQKPLNFKIGNKQVQKIVINKQVVWNYILYGYKDATGYSNTLVTTKPKYYKEGTEKRNYSFTHGALDNGQTAKAGRRFYPTSVRTDYWNHTGATNVSIDGWNGGWKELARYWQNHGPGNQTKSLDNHGLDYQEFRRRYDTYGNSTWQIIHAEISGYYYENGYYEVNAWSKVVETETPATRTATRMPVVSYDGGETWQELN